ncbi:glycosyltransferase family 4 protein [Chryseobacterium capnotolerans]|uniref:glycosyltransferase family 4 protein n=1 Tax=Chryseobacterium capnotolerans TaxID=2759528 RepID=UPI001E54968C|nr:glycosyltransferase family 1 protein [Chryseobacterium capnotolerans]UHO39176.1 glycosyltransferase family 4 protein [Chryseobacterium capnotolerans]
MENKKIRVIYNGVSDDFFKIEHNFNLGEIDKRFLSLEDTKYLLFVGRRNSYKNFHLVVKAACLVKSEYKLVIVGEELNKEEYALINKYLGDHFIIFNKLDNNKLNYLYNKAFVLLYPSLYEGFGIPIVEAMKAHCPVIAANNSSIPEVAGDAAILYDNINENLIVDGIKKLESTSFRADIIKKGIQQFPKFDWNKTYLNYLEFYKELYDGK